MNRMMMSSESRILDSIPVDVFKSKELFHEVIKECWKQTSEEKRNEMKRKFLPPEDILPVPDRDETIDLLLDEKLTMFHVDPVDRIYFNLKIWKLAPDMKQTLNEMKTLQLKAQQIREKEHQMKMWSEIRDRRRSLFKSSLSVACDDPIKSVGELFEDPIKSVGELFDDPIKSVGELFEDRTLKSSFMLDRKESKVIRRNGNCEDRTPRCSFMLDRKESKVIRRNLNERYLKELQKLTNETEMNFLNSSDDEDVRMKIVSESKQLKSSEEKRLLKMMKMYKRKRKMENAVEESARKKTLEEVNEGVEESATKKTLEEVIERVEGRRLDEVCLESPSIPSPIKPKVRRKSRPSLVTNKASIPPPVQMKATVSVDKLTERLRDSMTEKLRDSMTEKLRDSMTDKLRDSMTEKLRDSMTDKLRDSMGAAIFARKMELNLKKKVSESAGDVFDFDEDSPSEPLSSSSKDQTLSSSSKDQKLSSSSKDQITQSSITSQVSQIISSLQAQTPSIPSSTRSASLQAQIPSTRSASLQAQIPSTRSPASVVSVYSTRSPASVVSVYSTRSPASVVPLYDDPPASFFSLIRNVFQEHAPQDKKLTLHKLEELVKEKLKTIDPKLGWSHESLQSAMNFLSYYSEPCQTPPNGAIPSQESQDSSSSFPGSDMVPVVDYKEKNQQWQWIGGNRDSDEVMKRMSDEWNNEKDRNPSSLSDPSAPVPPPLFPTEWTVKPASVEEQRMYREQEAIRYNNPSKAFTYRVHDYEAVVGPVKGSAVINIAGNCGTSTSTSTTLGTSTNTTLGTSTNTTLGTSTTCVTPTMALCPSASPNKAREHSLLVNDRPPFVTLLSLVRDAAARLPNGEGTRADICELLKDSQYLLPTVSDQQVNQIVSGALDRLHYEKDPCVKYDTNRKVWIYLHRNRTENDFERLHEMQVAAAKAKRNLSKSRKPSLSKTSIASPPMVGKASHHKGLQRPSPCKSSDSSSSLNTPNPNTPTPILPNPNTLTPILPNPNTPTPILPNPNTPILPSPILPSPISARIAVSPLAPKPVAIVPHTVEKTVLDILTKSHQSYQYPTTSNFMVKKCPSTNQGSDQLNQVLLKPVEGSGSIQTTNLQTTNLQTSNLQTSNLQTSNLQTSNLSPVVSVISVSSFTPVNRVITTSPMMVKDSKLVRTMNQVNSHQKIGMMATVTRPFSPGGDQVANFQPRQPNQVPGNQISGNQVSGNQVPGNQISGIRVSQPNQNQVSGIRVSGNQVSGIRVSGNQISGIRVSQPNQNEVPGIRVSQPIRQMLVSQPQNTVTLPAGVQSVNIPSSMILSGRPGHVVLGGKSYMMATTSGGSIVLHPQNCGQLQAGQQTTSSQLGGVVQPLSVRTLQGIKVIPVPTQLNPSASNQRVTPIIAAHPVTCQNSAHPVTCQNSAHPVTCQNGTLASNQQFVARLIQTRPGQVAGNQMIISNNNNTGYQQVILTPAPQIVPVSKQQQVQVQPVISSSFHSLPSPSLPSPSSNPFNPLSNSNNTQ